MTFQFVSSYCDYNYSTCNSCVFCCINHNCDCYNGSHLLGLSSRLGQNDVGLLPPLIPRNMIRIVDGFITVSQHQPQCQMPSQAYAYYAIGLQVSFISQSCSFQRFLYVGVCYRTTLGKENPSLPNMEEVGIW